MLTATLAPRSHELPPELWMRIFALTITRPAEDDLDLPEPHISLPPLLLGRVSRHWRELSLSCSELWSSLGIRVTNESLEHGVLDGIERWISRAQDRPLELAFCGDDAPNAVINEFLRRVLWKHLPRTRSLMVRMWGGIDDEPWLAPPELEVLPLLEAIQLTIRRQEFVQWLTPMFYAHLPALRRLIMADYVLAVDQIYLPLEQHLAQLTYIQVATNNFRQHPCWVLQQCRNLVSCSLSFRIQLPHPRAFEGTVVLPRLRALHLWNKRSSYWKDIFAVSTFPALEELEVSGDIWPLQSVIPFLSRSRCTLRILRLSNSNINEDALLAILRAPQVDAHLELLELSAYPRADGPPFQPLPLSDGFIRALNPSLTPEVLLPRLQSIEVDGLWGSALPWDDGVFADMVVARYRSATATVAKPTRVALYENAQELAPSHVKDFEVLRALRKEGLHVDLLPNFPTSS